MKFNFDRTENDFDRIFESNIEVNSMFNPRANSKTPSNSKEDKLERLKKFNEYWDFEKNYHYNSDIDVIIRKINSENNFSKQEQIKLMRDVIERICGDAAKYLGLSWDIIGDDRYLFGFYETTGSKNHMQILIPYDFKFSTLKQKMLDWFLKKKESQKGNMDSVIGNQKKPNIKIVESVFNKIKKTVGKDIEDDIERKHICIDNNYAFKNIIELLTKKLGIPDANQGDTILYGPKGRLDIFEKNHSLRFITEIKLPAQEEKDAVYGCEFLLNFFDDDTFTFYVYIEYKHYPQRRIYYFGENNTLIRQQGECSALRKKIVTENSDRLPLTIERFKLLKSFVTKYCQNVFNNVLVKTKTPFIFDYIEIYLHPEHEEFVYDTFVKSLKENNIKSSLLNESVFKSIKNTKKSSLDKVADNIIKVIDFKNKEVEKICIETWGSHQSKLENKFYFSDAEKVKNLGEACWILDNNTKKFDFDELKYFTSVRKISHNDLDGLECYLNSITLPPNLEVIDDFAFSRFELTELTIPKSVKILGKYIFYLSGKLNTVKFEEGSNLKIIKEECFESAGRLTNITLPEGLEEIGNYAFNKTNIQKLKLPKSVKKIEGYVGCEIELQKGTQFQEEDGVIYSPDGKTALSFFKKFGGNEKIIIKEGTEIIGKKCFFESNIQNVRFPSTLRIIEDEAFASCKLNKLIIPEGVERIGKNSFKRCDTLQDLKLPSTLKIIDEKAFIQCKLGSDVSARHKRFDLSNLVNLEVLGDSCFCQNDFEEVILPAYGKIKILKNTFEFSKNLKKCILPEGIETLEGTFYNCENLEEIGQIPSTVIKIIHPFRYCGNLDIKYETLPSNWQVIDSLERIHVEKQIITEKDCIDGKVVSSKFNNLRIDELIFAEGVKSIPSRSFKNCNAKKVIFPSSIESLETSCIDTAQNTVIYFKPSKKIPAIDKMPFSLYDTGTIFCNDKLYNSFTKYKKYIEMFGLKNPFYKWEIKKFGDTSENNWDEEFVPKRKYDENLLGSIPYSYKFLFRNLVKNDNSTEIEIYKRIHGTVEGCPEYKSEWKCNGYSEKSIYGLFNGINNLDFKEKLNNVKMTKSAVLEFINDICKTNLNLPSDRERRIKTKVLFNDDFEIDINVTCEIKKNIYQDSKIMVWDRNDFIFRLIFDGKTESPHFSDTMLPKLFDDAEIRQQRLNKSYERSRKQYDKEEERLRKQREKERRKLSKFYERQRIKEEKERQKILKKLMKSGSKTVNSENSLEESFKTPWFMFDFDRLL